MILNNTLDYAYTSRALDQKYYIKPGLTRSRRVVKGLFPRSTRRR